MSWDLKTPNSHLSSEQLERALAGQMSPDVAQHVSACARCTSEISGTRELFSGFRQSAALAAERALRMPPKPAPRRIAPLWRFATAVVFIGVMVPVAQRAVHPPVAPQAPAAADHAAAAISDDALLNGVQDDLTSSVPASLLPLADASTQGIDLTATEQRKTQ